MTTQDRIKKDLNYAGFFTVSNVSYSKELKQNINQPIILTVKNWDNHKDQFVTERSELYPDYKPDEIKRFELDIMRDLELYLNSEQNDSSIDKSEYKALIMRYSMLLKGIMSKKDIRKELDIIKVYTKQLIESKVFDNEDDRKKLEYLNLVSNDIHFYDEMEVTFIDILKYKMIGISIKEQLLFLNKLEMDIEEFVIWMEDKCKEDLLPKKVFDLKLKSINILRKQIEYSIDNKPKQKAEIKAPVIRRFCELVNDSKLIIRIDESASDYCKEVCNKFSLEYSDGVRKYFTSHTQIKKSDKHLQKVIELIFPMIPTDSRTKLEAYIDSKVNLSN